MINYYRNYILKNSIVIKLFYIYFRINLFLIYRDPIYQYNILLKWCRLKFVNADGQKKDDIEEQLRSDKLKADKSVADGEL
jgi:hypothetical protein